MEGVHNDEKERGIIPRSIEEIFKHITNAASPSVRFLVRASYLQIYNEVISDLLKQERTNLTIREDKRRGVYVEGLSEWIVRSPAEIYGLMERGASVRATGATKMNELSSRSHAIFIIIVEQTDSSQLEQEHQFKVGKLNLVDLAGSERVRISGATGVRLEETKKINQSLSALGNVISALTELKGRSHIPYRDSKLTRILEDSLGGNCKTTMMAMISPALEAFMESLSTLKFANRAKNIKNIAKINEDLDEKALLRRYERELQKLRSELAERQRNVVDKRKLLEVEEQRRRAEQDKLAAIIDLERLSKDLLAEKKEKKKLEARIKEMSSQMLGGGVADTQAFRSALSTEQDRIRKEYGEKLAILERERHSMEEDKAQVDRYKQLLLKQRDIMIQLTVRLNERDQSILQLQGELEEYEKQQRILEDGVDQKTAALLTLQKLAIELQNHQGDLMKNPSALAAALHDLVTPVLALSNSNPNGVDDELEVKPAFISDDRLRDLVKAINPNLQDVSDDLLEILRSKLAHLIAVEVEIKARSLQREMPSDAPEASLIASLISDSDQLKLENNRLQALLDAKPAANELATTNATEKLEEFKQSNADFRAEMAANLNLKSESVQQLQDENANLKLRLLELESKDAKSPQNGCTVDEFYLLKSRYDDQVKERVALKTILEQKMKVIVDDIAVAINATDQSKQFPASARVKREVDILQRLINASVHALQTSLDENLPIASTRPSSSPAQSEQTIDSSRSLEIVAESTRAPSPRSVLKRTSGNKGNGNYASSFNNVFGKDSSQKVQSGLDNVFFVSDPKFSVGQSVKK